MLRYIRKAAFVVSVIYVVSLPVSFLVGGILFARPFREPVGLDALKENLEPGWSHGLLSDSREVKIQVEPRIRLNATVFGGDSSSTVIVLHEAGKNRVQGLSVAYSLWKQGLGVVLLDRRAHGNSDGEARPLYGGEAEDLSAIVDQMLSGDWCGSGRIGMFGIGDAGTSCLIAAAADPRVDAVAAENPGLEADEFIGDQLSSTFGLPKALLIAQSMLAVRGMAVIAGISMSDLDAAALTENLSAPTMIASRGAYGSRAHKTIDKIGSGNAEWCDLDISSGYSEIAAFFQRSL